MEDGCLVKTGMETGRKTIHAMLCREKARPLKTIVVVRVDQGDW
jgi:hypothetical protein